MLEGTEQSDLAEDSVRVATPNFARRRFRSRLRRLRPFLLAGLAVLLVATAGWLLYFSSVVTVESVEVTGNSAAVSSARIERAAAVTLGEQLIRVDLAVIRARVERIDAVESAEVSRSWPDTVAIRITERVPIAVVRTGGNERALSADGVVFERKKGSLPPGLPVIETGVNPNAATLSEAARVVVALRSDIAARVELITADSIDKIVLNLSGGVTVEWGSAEDSENKAQVLEILLNKDVREIDVSVPGRPTTR